MQESMSFLDDNADMDVDGMCAVSEELQEVSIGICSGGKNIKLTTTAALQIDKIVEIVDDAL
eukprot:480717-Pelagomonas_calceolata.AAC.2